MGVTKQMSRRILSSVAVGFLLLELASPAKAVGIADAPPVQGAIQLADLWLEYQLARQGLPSISIGLVLDQDLLWAKSYGYADIANKAPATLDTIYSICSVSKLFTATAVMQLRDKGQLHMGQEVRELLPWLNVKRTFPGSGPITVHGLLTHSSGLPDDLEGAYWTEQTFPDREGFRNLLADAETLYPAAKKEEYSNVGYELAGYIVEERSGRPFAQYIQEEILSPLEMDDTTIDIPIDHTGDRLATAYSGGGRHNQREVIPPYQLKGLVAAAGMASTVNDIVKFIRWQFRVLAATKPELLKASTLREMYQVHWYNPGQSSHRGYGYSVVDLEGKLVVGKDGGCPGYVSLVILDPGTKLGGVILINANGTDVWDLLTGVVGLVAPALAKAASQAGNQPVDNVDLEKYEGVYRSYPADLEVGVVVDGNQLAFVFLNKESPADSMTRLTHVVGERFRLIGQDGEPGGFFEFTLDTKGDVTGIQQLGSGWKKTH